jgi:hypothetical protein
VSAYGVVVNYRSSVAGHGYVKWSNVAVPMRRCNDLRGEMDRCQVCIVGASVYRREEIISWRCMSLARLCCGGGIVVLKDVEQMVAVLCWHRRVTFVDGEKVNS